MLLVIAFINSNFKNYINIPNFIRILEQCLKSVIGIKKIELVTDYIYNSFLELCKNEVGLSLLRTYAYTEKDVSLQERIIQKVIVNLEFFTRKMEGYLILKHFIYGFCADQPLRTPILSKHQRLVQNLSKLDKRSSDDSCKSLREFINNSRIIPNRAICKLLKSLIDRMAERDIGIYCVDLIHFIYIKIEFFTVYSYMLADLMLSNQLYKLLDNERGVAIVQKYINYADFRSIIFLNQRLNHINPKHSKASSHESAIKELTKASKDIINYYMNLNTRLLEKQSINCSIKQLNLNELPFPIITSEVLLRLANEKLLNSN